MDTVCSLRYYDGVPVRKYEKASENETFATDIMIHLDHLYRVAFHLAKDRDQADDLVQETYLRALTSYRQFSPGTNLKAWLTKILYNFFFDSYDKRKRMVSLENKSAGPEPELDPWASFAAEGPTPEDLALRGELNGKINDALKKIPAEFRVPIILVDMGDLSYGQAADILSCPVGTIRSRLSRGRRLLHKRLSGYVGLVGR
jgi:RNA polymerase sigma-70 factor (ECF subfamily)